MLVHVSRFKDVHQARLSGRSMNGLTISNAGSNIGSSDEDDPSSRLRELWEQDFVPTLGDDHEQRDADATLRHNRLV